MTSVIRRKVMRLVYYKRKHTNLIYEKVNGHWNWSFADDHENIGMLSKPELLNRMPCMAKILAGK
jgi:hypothetical protein